MLTATLSMSRVLCSCLSLLSCSAFLLWFVSPVTDQRESCTHYGTVLTSGFSRDRRDLKEVGVSPFFHYKTRLFFRAFAHSVSPETKMV